MAGKATALMVGTAVCIAASIAGDTSQDLKTGFVLGATPRLQQIGELAGEVKRIGMRSSTVRTWQGAEVIVPNGNLISNEVINWTLSDSLRRLDVPVK